MQDEKSSYKNPDMQVLSMHPYMEHMFKHVRIYIKATYMCACTWYVHV